MAQGEDEFRTLFEDSIRLVKPVGIFKGKAVGITHSYEVVDVGYKT